MSLQDDAQAALTAVQQVVDDVNNAPVDPNVAVVAAMVTALEDAGYTVTPPSDLSVASNEAPVDTPPTE